MGDIAEDLSSAWDQDQGDVTEEVTETEQAEVTEDHVEETVDTEQPEGEEVTEETEETAETEQTEEVASAIEAPKHWSKEHREMFAQQTPEAQAWLLDRHKSMEGDYTKKTMEMADFNRTYEPVAQLFSQYPQLNPAETIQGWANIAMSLEANPQQTLQYLANQYQVDLNDMPEQEAINPQVQALSNELNTLKTQLASQQENDRQAAASAKLSEIERFAQETDDQGGLLRPYIEQALPMMTNLAQVAMSQGEQADLQTLYEQAIYANPEIRDEILKAEQAQQEERRKQEAIAKAKKAQARTKTLDSEAGESEAGELSLREELAKQFG